MVVEFDGSQACSNSPNKFSGQLVTCDPQGLRPHPSYARHGLAVSADELSAIRVTEDLAFLEPLAITRDRIIDGYACWKLAKEVRRETGMATWLLCLISRVPRLAMRAREFRIRAPRQRKNLFAWTRIIHRYEPASNRFFSTWLNVLPAHERVSFAEGHKFSDRDVTKDVSALDELKRLGAITTPVTLIGSETIIGFDPEKIDKALAISGRTGKEQK
jgi:hypothetical protein